MLFFLNVLSSTLVIKKNLILYVCIERHDFQVFFYLFSKCSDVDGSNSVRTINGNFRHVAFLYLFFLLNKLLKVNERICIVVYIRLNRGAESVIHSHIVQLRRCDQTLLYIWTLNSVDTPQ